MAKKEDIPTDLAFEIGANLGPKQFVAAARHFFALIEGLWSNVGEGKAIEWEVCAREGSTVLAMQPRGDMPTKQVGRLYNRVEKVTRALASGDIEAANLDERELDHARALSDLSRENGSVIPLRFWVRRQPILYGPDIADYIREDHRGGYVDFGSLEGRLQAIQDARGTLELKIRDVLYPAAIRCIVPETMLDEALEYFRHRVEVTGEITYRAGGTPTSISVGRIDLLPEDDDLPTADDVRGILGGTAV
jgi:hypothetical protein